MKKLLLPMLTFLIIQSGCNFFSSGIPELKLIPYKAGEKWGFIDRNGKIIINPQFDNADNFIEGIAMVENNKKIGYIDEGGKYIVNIQYLHGTAFSDGLAAVTPKDGHIQFIDKTGKLKFTLAEATHCSNFKEGLAAVEVNGKWGYIDENGKMVIIPQFSNAYCFSDGLAAVQSLDNEDPNASISSNDKKWGFIDKHGNIVINYQFDDSNDPRFIDGLASVKLGGKYGFIDKTGKFVINPQFDQASYFSEGLAKIEQDSTYGFVNEKGKIEINPQFKYALDFQNGTAAVQSSEGKWGYIDKEGKYIINPQFEEVSKFYGDFAIVVSGKAGIIDKEGKYLANPQFDNMAIIFDGYSFINPNIKSDYFDIKGIINAVFGSATKNYFMGINANTTYEQLSKTFNLEVNHNDYIHDNASCDTNLDVIEGVKLNGFRFDFSKDLVKEIRPIYRFVKQNNYSSGNHEVQVVDHYENIPNANAKIYAVSFSLECTNEKAYEKYEDIVKQLQLVASSKFRSEKDGFDGYNEYVGKGLKLYFKEVGDVIPSVQFIVIFFEDTENTLSVEDSAAADSILNSDFWFYLY